MTSLTFSTRLLAAIVVCAVAPTLAHAQSDTVTISGTFQMSSTYGFVGPDLAGVYDRQMDHTWTLTLSGVTYEYDYTFEDYTTPEWGFSYYEKHVTRAHPTSFSLEFFGPDADTLNAVVSSQLTRGGNVNGAPVSLWIDEDYSENFPEWSSITFYCSVYLLPEEFSNGISFSALATGGASRSESYPDFTERQLYVQDSEIYDRRAGYLGTIECSRQRMIFGSSIPPTISPALSILDSSVFEGDRGKSQLKLEVTLSGASDQTITVSYHTKNGTAAAKSDYIATSGTLTFSPGETQKSISVSIVGDRKREPDETFTVQLSSPSGAKLFDSTATATILNDD